MSRYENYKLDGITVQRAPDGKNGIARSMACRQLIHWPVDLISSSKRPIFLITYCKGSRLALPIDKTGTDYSGHYCYFTTESGMYYLEFFFTDRKATPSDTSCLQSILQTKLQMCACHGKYSPVLISGTLSRVPRPGTQKDAFLVLIARFVTLLGCPRSGRDCTLGNYVESLVYTSNVLTIDISNSKLHVRNCL